MASNLKLSAIVALLGGSDVLDFGVRTVSFRLVIPVAIWQSAVLKRPEICTYLQMFRSYNS